MKSTASAELFGSLPSHVAQQPSHLPTSRSENSHSRSDLPRDRYQLVIPVAQSLLEITEAKLAHVIDTIADAAHGSERRIRHPLMRCSVFTGCFQTFCDAASCHWFADLIASYQSPLFIQAHPFQLWTLRRIEHPPYTGVATMQEDTYEIPIIEQFIPYTDFPLAEFACYTCHDTTSGNHLAVTMLKEEY